MAHHNGPWWAWAALAIAVGSVLMVIVEVLLGHW
jgi:hypothetical protein